MPKSQQRSRTSARGRGARRRTRKSDNFSLSAVEQMRGLRRSQHRDRSRPTVSDSNCSQQDLSESQLTTHAVAETMQSAGLVNQTPPQMLPCTTSTSGGARAWTSASPAQWTGAPVYIPGEAPPAISYQPVTSFQDTAVQSHQSAANVGTSASLGQYQWIGPTAHTVPVATPSNTLANGSAPLQSMSAGTPAPVQMATQGAASFNTSGQTVLILGSSIIKRAEAHVKGRPMGRHLGLTKSQVIWAGVSGLRYSQVLNIANSLRQCTPVPNYLIIHFGGNDLGSENCGLLRKNLKHVVFRLMQLFPDTCIIYSCILPRLSWRYSYNNKTMEKSRYRVNRALMRYVVQHGHKAIKHLDFNDKMPGLFLSDGVHLSPVGNDIFLSTLQSALEAFRTSSIPIYPAS